MYRRKEVGDDSDASGHSNSGQGFGAKNTPYSLGNKAPKQPKAARLEWEQINSATWRLAEPDGPKVETPRCHGHWPGFHTPKAVAWVFDVGANGSHDWRVRVRKRGGWTALGSVIDADLAKRLAEAAVDGVPFRNVPPDVPLNLLGGDRRWPKKRNDITTRAKIVHTEVGGEILEWPTSYRRPTTATQSIPVHPMTNGLTGPPIMVLRRCTAPSRRRGRNSAKPKSGLRLTPSSTS